MPRRKTLVCQIIGRKQTAVTRPNTNSAMTSALSLPSTTTAATMTHAIRHTGATGFLTREMRPAASNGTKPITSISAQSPRP